MKVYQTVIICVLAIILLADTLNASPIRSRRSRHLRSRHFRDDEALLDEAISVINAEVELNSRLQQSRRRRRSLIANARLMRIHFCINLIRRRGGVLPENSGCDNILGTNFPSKSNGPVIVVEK